MTDLTPRQERVQRIEHLREELMGLLCVPVDAAIDDIATMIDADLTESVMWLGSDQTEADALTLSIVDLAIDVAVRRLNALHRILHRSN